MLHTSRCNDGITRYTGHNAGNTCCSGRNAGNTLQLSLAHWDGTCSAWSVIDGGCSDYVHVTALSRFW